MSRIHLRCKQTLETVPPLSLQAEEQEPESQEITLFGKVAADIFSCDKHLLSGVTIRISFVRSKLEFVLIYDADAKNYKITPSQANLYLRRMTVSDQVYTAIEKTLTKTPALYRYTEIYRRLTYFHKAVEVGAKRMYSVGRQTDVLRWLSFPIKPSLAPN